MQTVHRSDGVSMKAAGVILFFLLVPRAGLSQQSLTLGDCLRIAEQRSPVLRSVTNDSGIAALDRENLRSENLPQISLEGSAAYAPHGDRSGYDPALTDGGQLGAQVVLRELLYDGGSRGIRIDQSKIDIQRLTREQRRALRDLRSGVTQAFIEAMRARDEEVLQARRVEELSEYLDVVTRLRTAGTRPLGDALKIRVDLGRARMDGKKATETLGTAKYALTAAMGIPPDTTFSVAGDLDTLSYAYLDSLLGLAVDSAVNLDLQIAALEVKHGLLDVDLARSSRRPTVTLSADAGLLTSVDNLRLPQPERAGMAGASVGLNISNLLIDWGTAGRNVEARQIEADNLRIGYETLRRSVDSEMNILRARISTARVLLGQTDKNLQAAEDNYLYTRSLYAGGGTTAFEVLSAWQLLVDIRLERLNGLADLHRAATQLVSLVSS